MIEFTRTLGSQETIIFYALIGAFVCLGVFGFALWVRLSDLKRIFSQKKVFIEVTPPRTVSKSPEAMEQLFNLVSTLSSTKRFRHRVLRRNTVFSLEIIASKSNGIRYVIGTSEREAAAIERSILAYLSDAKLSRIDDPLQKRGQHTLVKEFKQTKHYALPIRTIDSFEKHDPIAFIATSMNELAEGEQMALQLVIAPARIRNMAAIVQRYFEFYKVSEATHNKGYGMLFRTDLRVRVVAQSPQSKIRHMHAIESTMRAFDIPKVQTLKARYNFPENIRGQYREWCFVHRMPAIIHKNSNIFSSLELANIYHFPANQNRTENINKSLSRTLPAPLSLRGTNDFSVILGQTNHFGEKYKIGLTTEERARHALYIGKTGSGKTTMLEYEIIQDINNGHGVIFIDPHGDAAEDILKRIPESRIDDVIYFNPDDIDYPVALNMLEIPEEVTGNELLRQKDLVTETLITVFRKVFSDGDDSGSRVEAALRNTIQTALTLKDPTIFTLYKLINDPVFRKKAVLKLEDQNLRDYWVHEVGAAGAMQRVKMMQGVTTKLSRFIFAPYAERIMNYPKSSIDFNDVLASKKILICNLAKGKIGEDTSQLFGVMLLAKIQMAALARANMKKEDRTPVYIYIDEFQNFATPSFVEMLAEARKYGISMNMAQQTLSQQHDEKMISTIVANSGTIVLFQTASLDDRRHLGHLFEPSIDISEIQNLPAFNFYVRLNAIKSQEPVSGQTIQLDGSGELQTAKKIILSSRERYGRKYEITK
ncbi:MAG TPA: TraM recognition domain-containing protein [Verrucomicrobiae bacterium]|nr:TraM recognition domain-containing protein [Verrucomicrobiae bacterium]